MSFSAVLKQRAAGRAWAERVFSDRIASGDLPNLGAGYSDRLRAARAVSGICERRLYAGSCGRRQELPMRPDQRAFWRAALEWANARAIEEQQ